MKLVYEIETDDVVDVLHTGANSGEKRYTWDEKALAILLLDDVVFVNERDYTHSFDGGPFKKDGSTVVVWVGCNDVFMWGLADAEDLPMSELGNLLEMHLADKKWGVTRWCILRRNCRPQKPMEDAMKAEGVWDEVLESIPRNVT